MKKLIVLVLLCAIALTSCVSLGPDKGNEVAKTFAMINTSKIDENTSKWRVDYYVDEFENYTKDAYVINDKWIKGTFTNSATNGSDAYLKVLCNKGSMGIELFEYNTNFPVSFLSFEHVKVSIREENGEVTVIKDLNVYEKYKRAYFEYNYFVKIAEIFARNTKVQLLFEVTSQYSSPDTYLFNVDTTGFVWAYQQAFCK